MDVFFSKTRILNLSSIYLDDPTGFIILNFHFSQIFVIKKHVEFQSSASVFPILDVTTPFTFKTIVVEQELHRELIKHKYFSVEY